MIAEPISKIVCDPHIGGMSWRVRGLVAYKIPNRHNASTYLVFNGTETICAERAKAICFALMLQYDKQQSITRQRQAEEKLKKQAVEEQEQQLIIIQTYAQYMKYEALHKYDYEEEQQRLRTRSNSEIQHYFRIKRMQAKRAQRDAW